MKQTVIGGFSTEFSFRVVPRDEDKSPGPCKWVDHSEGKCARRGGDGFAFVVQNYSPKALGSGGGGLGYSGISNAVVVEFDTWFDSELKDPFENHLAVLTRGVGELRAEHNNHLGVCLDVPDLADGKCTLCPWPSARSGCLPGRTRSCRWPRTQCAFAIRSTISN